MGARRSYAVPAILESAGKLERFYTDACGDVGIGRLAAPLSTVPVVGTRLKRLANRRVPPSVRARTYTFDLTVIRHGFRRSLGSNDLAAQFREHLRFGRDIGRAMTAEGYGAATHIYSMLGEGGDYLREGRRRGLGIVCEVYIALSADRILAAERRTFPTWEPDVPDYEAMREGVLPRRVLLECTDHFICPSDFVRDDLIANWGVPGERATVVPYGIHSGWIDADPKPVRGRILFVGSASLRKGIHYLAMAAEKLSGRGRRYEFRIAGDVADSVRTQSACRNLTFLGRVPRDRVKLEFLEADLLVLPTLAEGSAGATYEALAAGLPVITTGAAGSVVRDGIEGRLVLERAPDLLADAIEEIVEDRPSRDRMAHAARERSRAYTWDRYGERLMKALRGASW